MPLDISEEDVHWVATRPIGASGPSGTDPMAFQIWLLRFGTSSESIREKMALWTDCLTNGSPPWPAYSFIMAAWLVALENFLGVRLVSTGDVCRRLIVNIFLRERGAQAKEACRRVNICAGLEAGIEGAIHTVRKR